MKPTSLLLCSLIASVRSQSNLPDVPSGVFTVGARIEITNSTSAAAWEALMNFPAYPDWNPFVRSSIAVSPKNITLPEQRPVEGNRLFLRTQIPPLPLPVNRNTPDNPLHTNLAYENVTHVQPELKRVAWAYAALPEESFAAERWQAISDLPSGNVLYESREVFHGPLAKLLQQLQGETLQQSFEAQAQGLKLYLETSSPY